MKGISYVSAWDRYLKCVRNRQQEKRNSTTGRWLKRSPASPRHGKGQRVRLTGEYGVYINRWIKRRNDPLKRLSRSMTENAWLPSVCEPTGLWFRYEPAPTCFFLCLKSLYIRSFSPPQDRFVDAVSFFHSQVYFMTTFWCWGHHFCGESLKGADVLINSANFPIKMRFNRATKWKSCFQPCFSVSSLSRLSLRGRWIAAHELIVQLARFPISIAKEKTYTHT